MQLPHRSWLDSHECRSKITCNGERCAVEHLDRPTRCLVRLLLAPMVRVAPLAWNRARWPEANVVLELLSGWSTCVVSMSQARSK